MLKTEAAVQRAQPHSRQQFDLRNWYMRDICPLSLQFYGLLADHQTEYAGKVSDQYYGDIGLIILLSDQLIFRSGSNSEKECLP